MFLNDIKRIQFVDDLAAPSTVSRPEKFAGHTFENTKKYFTIYLVPTASVGRPPVIRFFDIEHYYANKAWYDSKIVVNGNKKYEYILNQVANNAYLLLWMKINWRFNSVTLDSQLQEPFYKVYKNADGIEQEDIIVSSTVLDIYQQNLTTVNIDMKEDYFLLDGLTYLQYNLVQDLSPVGMYINMYYQEEKKSNVIKDINKSLTEF